MTSTTSMRGLAGELACLRRSVVDGSDPAATATQHDKGKLTARERLALLFDDATFSEIEPFRRRRPTPDDPRRPYTDGVVAGWGAVHGRTVFAYAHDFRVFGGSLGEAHADKIHKVMDLALANGAPLVAVCDGAGARIQEGVTALAGYGGIFRRNVSLSGVVPQISVVVGPCAGGASYSPALTDLVFMVRDVGQMFVTGPDVVASVTGEAVTHEDLGGAGMHATTSGVAAFVHDDEPACFEEVRFVLSLLPSNNREQPPFLPPADPVDRRTDALYDIVPAQRSSAYDVRAVIEEIVDDGVLVEVHEAWARNVVCALARLGGRVVGVVANQPAHLAGALDMRSSEKAARFVQMCDSFNVPLVTLVDVPGFLPGLDQERGGIIRHGAKLLYAYCNATVPRIQLILRKAYGGAYIVMDSRSVGADLSLAWPANEIAVMGATAATNVLHRREIAAADDPDAARARRVAEYEAELMHPYYAAERGLVDDVIDPGETRRRLIDGLRMLAGKQADVPTRKHGNQPQ